MNTDGSVTLENSCATAGGILKDSNGDWMGGFLMNLGKCTITKVEFLGLREGMRLAWEWRFEKIIFEVDSKVTIHLVQKAETELHPLGAIIEDCRAFLRRPWQATLQHTLREGNCCADYLAKRGHDITVWTKQWDSPSGELNPDLALDKD